MHIGAGMIKLQQVTKWDVFLRHSVQTRPTPLLDLMYWAPEHETLGNWTDGRISCRHSAASSSLPVVLHYKITKI